MPKISQFPSGGVAQNTDLIPVVRNGGDYTITGYNLAALASYGQAYTGTFTATAGQTVFTLPASPGSLANLAISVDGAVMVPGTDYMDDPDDTDVHFRPVQRPDGAVSVHDERASRHGYRGWRQRAAAVQQ